MNKYRAVIFDLDDTLYPERDYVCSGFKVVAAWAESNLGIPADAGFSELIGLFDQGLRTDTFSLWLEQRGIDASSLLPDLIQLYRDHPPVIRPFDGVPELLSRLKPHFQLGLLTDGSAKRQQMKMTALGLGSYFDAIIYTDEWGRAAWKPNPWMFGILLEQFGLAGTQAIYVGDNPLKDFQGARTANIYTIRIRIACGLYSSLNPQDYSFAPDREVTSHEELADVLLQKQ